MKRLTKLTLSCLVIASIAACGPTDPSKDDNNGGGNNGMTNNGMTNNGMTNNGGNNGNNGMTNNGMTNNGMTNNGMTNNGGGVCEPNTVFFGQVGDAEDVHGGGVPDAGAVLGDAGLQAVWDATFPMEGMNSDVTFAVSGALVIGTRFGDNGNTNFWVQDANAAMQVFLGFDNPVGETVKVGDLVSFTVTSLGNFSGHPQIAALTDYTVMSTGNPVPFADLTGTAPTLDNYYKLARISGTLGSVATDCGGSSKCYDLTHGTQTITYRSASEFVEPGDCVTFFGPLGAFPGPRNDDGTPPEFQLDVLNFDWSWTEFN